MSKAFYNSIHIKVKDSKLSLFFISFLFPFLGLRVRVSIMLQLWLYNHISQWKDVEGSGRMISYNIFNIC